MSFREKITRYVRQRTELAGTSAYACQNVALSKRHVTSGYRTAFGRFNDRSRILQLLPGRQGNVRPYLAWLVYISAEAGLGWRVLRDHRRHGISEEGEAFGGCRSV